MSIALIPPVPTAAALVILAWAGAVLFGVIVPLLISKRRKW